MDTKHLKNGNFKDIINARKGNLWVVGHFMKPDSPFKINDFELKWGHHYKGESKQTLGVNIQAKTLTFLIRGKIALKFPDQNRKIILEKEGDYVYLDKGISHTWSVLEETLILTIRWPSIPNDQKNLSQKF